MERSASCQERSVSCQDLRDGEISQLPRSEGWRDQPAAKRDQSAAKIWGMERAVSCQDLRKGEISRQLPRFSGMEWSVNCQHLRDGEISRQLPRSEGWKNPSAAKDRGDETVASIWWLIQLSEPGGWQIAINWGIRFWPRPEGWDSCQNLRDKRLPGWDSYQTWGMRQLSEPEG